jgi:hypothetical protein
MKYKFYQAIVKADTNYLNDIRGFGHDKHLVVPSLQVKHEESQG